MSQAANALQRIPGIDFLRALPRVAQMGIAAALIAIFVVAILWSREPNYAVLFSQIDDRDGGAIITALEQMNVPYELKDHGNAIYVPKDLVHEARMNLAAQGLPKGGNIGYEIMDDTRFGASQFAEQINYQRALEGELAQTIESLFSVEKARVHLAIPRDTLFTRDQRQASASVLLSLYPGRHLSAEQVSAITWLVSSSIPNLSPEHVSVVDQSGRLLSATDEDKTHRDYQRQITQEVEQLAAQRIMHILTPILGEENVRAQVSAEIDFIQREETMESYTPNQKPGEAAIRSEQLETSIENQPSMAQGVPGALTNQPPAPAIAPIVDPEQTEENNDESTPPEQTNSTTNQLLEALELSQLNLPQGNARSEIIRNYEVDRRISHIKGAKNQLKRLSVAVIVNEKRIDDEWQPLSENELTNLRDLVKQAVGFRHDRGDTISVVNTRFSTTSTTDNTYFWHEYNIVEMGFTLLKYLLLAILFFAIWRIIIHPIIQNGIHAWAQAQAMRAERENAIEQEKQVKQRAAEINRYEENLNTARGMAEKDPRAVAMVLRAWMSQDQKDDSQKRR